MNPNLEGSQDLSDAACTEAAGWITRLHGPQRTQAAEAGFRRWLSENPENAKAFEFLTEVWETSGQLRRRPLEHVKSWQLPGMRISLSRAALAACAIAVMAVLGTLFYIHSNGVSTGIGEQRTLVLEDGSRVYLNTNSRAKVRFDDRTRRVELEQGEALFEVAKQTDRPFEVLAGGQTIRALGTSFVVRRDAERVAVTLVEGKVAVTSADRPGPIEKPTRLEVPPSRPVKAVPEKESKGVITLAPGQRITLAENLPVQIDTPKLSKLMAWQRGQVDLEGMRLAEAVSEMNRYTPKHIVIEGSQLGEIRVSGLFVASDTDNFVAAVAYQYDLDVTRAGDEIVLRSKNP